MKTSILKILLLSVILSLLHILFLPLSGVTNTISLNSIIWGLLSSLLVVCLLTVYTRHSSLSGIKLVIALFIIYFGIGHFNLLIEAYIFNVTDRTKTLNDLLNGFIIVTIFCPIIVLILHQWKTTKTNLDFEKRTVFSWIWKTVLGMFLYVIFYTIAGMILQATYPKLMEYYADKIPPLDVMFLTQIPRSLLFVLIATLILRTLNLSKLKTIVFAGLTFSILGAIAPLLPPSELMPQHIRQVHGIEVGISNFVYGMIIGLILYQKPKTSLDI